MHHSTNPDEKWCTLGKHFAPRTDFYPSSLRSDGLSNGCRDCNSKRSKVYHATVRREQRFGVTNEQFETMLAQQEYECAVCGNGFESTACVDHDHKTGKVRKLLCQNCNRALGLIHDDPRIAQSMVDYLREYGVAGGNPT